MIIDSHAHVNAPPELYVFKTQLIAGRGYADATSPNISDEGPSARPIVR